MMITAIDRATALLAAATEAPCTHKSTIGTCCAARINARATIERLGFTPDTLRVVVLGFEALECEGHTGLGTWCGIFDERGTCLKAKNCDCCVALAEFEKLFPEEK